MEKTIFFVTIYSRLGCDLALARYQPRPCRQQNGFAPTFFSEIYISQKYFFENIFGETNEEGLTDRTHARIVSFIVLDVSVRAN